MTVGLDHQSIVVAKLLDIGRAYVAKQMALKIVEGICEPIIKYALLYKQRSFFPFQPALFSSILVRLHFWILKRL